VAGGSILDQQVKLPSVRVTLAGAKLPIDIFRQQFAQWVYLCGILFALESENRLVLRGHETLKEIAMKNQDQLYKPQTLSNIQRTKFHPRNWKMQAMIIILSSFIVCWGAHVLQADVSHSYGLQLILHENGHPLHKPSFTDRDFAAVTYIEGCKDFCTLKLFFLEESAKKCRSIIANNAGKVLGIYFFGKLVSRPVIQETSPYIAELTVVGAKESDAKKLTNAIKIRRIQRLKGKNASSQLK
jgi:hypothetical protein